MAGAGIAVCSMEVAGGAPVGQLKFVEAVCGNWLWRHYDLPECVIGWRGG